MKELIMPSFWSLGLIAITLLAFLGIVWIVETVRWRFWRVVIRQSGRCRYSGCLCPCHGMVEEAPAHIPDQPHADLTGVGYHEANPADQQLNLAIDSVWRSSNPRFTKLEDPDEQS